MNRPHAKIKVDDPLANRLIEGRIRSWLKLNLAYAYATTANDEQHQGVQNAEGHLDEFWIELVPNIVDDLKRAGLLKRSAEPDE